MLAEFAARMNCGGADVATTASFMRNMMHSQTRGSYDNVIATQTFGDEEEEEEVGNPKPCSLHMRQLHLQRELHGLCCPVMRAVRCTHRQTSMRTWV